MRFGLIYVRQSRHKDYERTVSPEVQEAHCRALPAVASCDHVEVYRDLDRSGGSMKKRKDWLRFVERITELRPAVIAIYDQSRTLRNTGESLEFYALMERLPEIEIVFHIGHFERSPAGEFTWTTMLCVRRSSRRIAPAFAAAAPLPGASGGLEARAAPQAGGGLDRRVLRRVDAGGHGQRGPLADFRPPCSRLQTGGSNVTSGTFPVVSAPRLAKT